MSTRVHTATPPRYSRNPRTPMRASRLTTLAADPLGGEDAIEIEASGVTATARLHCTAELATPIEPVTAARRDGARSRRRLAEALRARVLEGVYVKRDGCWRIGRLAFRAS